MHQPKPCPTCGGTAFGVEFDEAEWGTLVARLVCCRCGSDDALGPLSEPCATASDAEQAAIAAWNSLTPSRH